MRVQDLTDRDMKIIRDPSEQNRLLDMIGIPDTGHGLIFYEIDDCGRIAEVWGCDYDLPVPHYQVYQIRPETDWRGVVGTGIDII